MISTLSDRCPFAPPDRRAAGVESTPACRVIINKNSRGYDEYKLCLGEARGRFVFSRVGVGVHKFDVFVCHENAFVFLGVETTNRTNKTI